MKASQGSFEYRALLCEDQFHNRGSYLVAELGLYCEGLISSNLLKSSKILVQLCHIDKSHIYDAHWPLRECEGYSRVAFMWNFYTAQGPKIS